MSLSDERPESDEDGAVWLERRELRVMLSFIMNEAHARRVEAGTYWEHAELVSEEALRGGKVRWVVSAWSDEDADEVLAIVGCHLQEAFTMAMVIPVERIQDLLVCALEGGSNYWYEDLRVIDNAGHPENDGDGVHQYHVLPTVGGTIGLRATEDDEDYRLDRAGIQRGLAVMAEKYPRHWADFTSENDDAETGDVFLQCCLFGEIVYG